MAGLVFPKPGFFQHWSLPASLSLTVPGTSLHSGPKPNKDLSFGVFFCFSRQFGLKMQLVLVSPGGATGVTTVPSSQQDPHQQVSCGAPAQCKCCQPTSQLELFSSSSGISMATPSPTSAALGLSISCSSNHILCPALAAAQPRGSAPEPGCLQTPLSLQHTLTSLCLLRPAAYEAALDASSEDRYTRDCTTQIRV